MYWTATMTVVESVGLSHWFITTILSAADGITIKNWFCWLEVRPLGIIVSFTEIYIVLFDL